MRLPSLAISLLWLNLLSTWFLVGLIWFVQVVHYPLFDMVGRDGFAAYEAAHRWRTSLVVGPPMLVEVATALALILMPMRQVNQSLIWAGLLMVLGIWLLTAMASIPSHDVLSRGFNSKAYHFLVWSNGGRTLLWSARGVLMAYVVYTAHNTGDVLK